MNMRVVRRILQYVKPYRGLMIAVLFFALFSVPLGLLAPILIGRAIDAILGVGDVDFERVLQILLYLLATVLGASLFTWLLHSLTRRISALVAQDMRKAAFERISKAPLSYIDTHRHGDLVSRLVNDTDAVSEGLLQAISQLLPGIVTILMTIVLMVVLNVWIALVVIVITPLSIVFARFVGVRINKYFRRQGDEQGRLSGYINEMVGNQPLVQALCFEEGAAEVFASHADAYFDANFKATFYSSVINPGTRFVNAIVYAAVAVFGAIYAVRGGITVGGVTVFLSYANQYTRPFNEVTAVLTQMQSAIASAHRLFAVIDWEQERPDAPDAIAPSQCTGHVEASHVYFSYSEDKPLIEDFNMEALPGKRIALVGPTGCGKTTIINLLMRFYELNSGQITVDGVPTDKISRGALRGLYGMVLQETWLKRETVRENIAYARPDAGFDEIQAAAKTALAHSFIMRLPDGYDTILDSGGANLSAGQRQLLCIARIVLARPDMLILDEATSSIDTRTEIAIQRAMERLMEGHTSFIVAHRLSTIQSADMILVMNAGRIIERGTHRELLLENGFYAKLFKSQFIQDTAE